MTLRSLTRQTIAPEHLEVVVCDHQSQDGTREVCQSFRDRLDIKVVPVPYEGYSISEPKNVGILSARNEIIACIDSGILCPPGFAAAHRDFHLAHPGCYTVGPVHGWDAETEDPFWLGLVPDGLPKAEDLPACLQDQRLVEWRAGGMAATPWMLFWGCNFSARRDALLASGLFDKGFRGWGWDDLELGYRLEALGLRLHMPEAAWCLHYPHQRASAVSRRDEARANWLRSYRKHQAPELELWEVAEYWDYGRLYERMRDTLEQAGRVPALSSFEVVRHRLEDAGNILYFGYRPPEERLSADVTILSPVRADAGKPGVLYSFGVRTPFADQGFARVVLSDYWRHLGFGSGRRRPVGSFVRDEAARVGRRSWSGGEEVFGASTVRGGGGPAA